MILQLSFNAGVFHDLYAFSRANLSGGMHPGGKIASVHPLTTVFPR
jgi:hypothetical protein